MGHKICYLSVETLFTMEYVDNSHIWQLFWILSGHFEFMRCKKKKKMLCVYQNIPEQVQHIYDVYYILLCPIRDHLY
jgi:hypothetical protein